MRPLFFPKQYIKFSSFFAPFPSHFYPLQCRSLHFCFRHAKLRLWKFNFQQMFNAERFFQLICYWWQQCCRTVAWILAAHSTRPPTDRPTLRAYPNQKKREEEKNNRVPLCSAHHSTDSFSLPSRIPMARRDVEWYFFSSRLFAAAFRKGPMNHFIHSGFAMSRVRNR